MTGDGTRAPGARGKPAEWRADFRGGDSSYASVWLLLLLFPVYRGFVEGPLAGVAALVAVGAFSVVYAAGFGLADRRPLGWSRPARCGIWVAAMLLCAAAAWPFVGALVVFFTPYLSVFCAFHLRPSHSILAVGAIIAAGVGITALYGDGAVEAFSGTTIIVPAFLLLLAQVIQRQDRAEELAHELELTRQRETIALDVHDVLGHTLTVVNLKAEVARRLMDTDPERARAEVEQVAELSRTALAEVRQAVTRTRRPDLAGELARAHLRPRISGSVGIDLAFAAQGIYQAAVSFSPHVWDNSAGILLARSAGAVATAGDGTPWKPSKVGAVVGTAKAHAAVMEALQTVQNDAGEEA